MQADEGVELPKRQTKGSAGYDFYAPYDIDLKPGEWTQVDTGVRLDGTEVVSTRVVIPALRHNFGGDVWTTAEAEVLWWQWQLVLTPRSGLGTKFGMKLRNTVGKIDQDYRDNILVCLTVEKPLHIKKGERFLQGSFEQYGTISGEVVPTAERNGGHGSTGQ